MIHCSDQVHPGDAAGTARPQVWLRLLVFRRVTEAPAAPVAAVATEAAPVLVIKSQEAGGTTVADALPVLTVAEGEDGGALP